MPEPVPQTYELLLDDEPEAEPEGPVARASWRRIAIVTLAFLLGAAVGIAATVKQRDAAATRDQESTISLTVVAAGWPNINFDSGQAQIGFRVLNSGPLPVQIEQASVEVPGFAPGEASSSARTIDPNKWSGIVASTGPADCDTTADPGARLTAVLTVRSASGVVREIGEPIETMDASLQLDAWRQVCQQYGDPGVWAYVTMSSDITEESGELVLPVELSIEFGGTQGATLIGMAGNTFLDMRNVDPLGPLSAGQPFSVQVAIKECPAEDQVARAVQDPFLMRVTQGETEMEFPIDTYNPEFLVGVIELIHRVCDE